MAWIKRFYEVNLDLIQAPSLDKNWQSSPKGYLRQDVESWVRQLAEVQRLSREKGLGYAEFQSMRSSADPHDRALGTTHHKFYDHDSSGEATNRDHVSLAWNGQAFEVATNGRHRVQIAKDIGLSTMPAEVSVQEEHLDETQKHVRSSNLLMQKDRDVNVQTNLNMQRASPAQVQPGEASARRLWERGSSVEPGRNGRTER